ncbi:MAG: hypothetical protein EPO68_13890, partial [Planctomycetota bacterium]
MTFAKLIACPRALIALLLCAGVIWFGATHVPHHTADSPFQTLYLHLQPEPLYLHPPHHAAAEHTAAPSAAAEHAANDHAANDHAEPALVKSDLLLAIPAEFLPSLFTRPVVGAGGPEDAPGRVTRSLVLTNLQLFQLLSVVLVLVCFSGVPKHLRQGGGDALTRVATGFAQWIRDEMVYPVMHKEIRSEE